MLHAGNTPRYWLALLLLGLGIEGTALFYQYQLGYGPCALCIHTRIWLLGLIVSGIAGLWLHRHPFAVTTLHGLVALAMAGLAERSYQLLATERGWTMGSCEMDAGLPPWFALDQWFPTLFEVQEMCGYTPELLFGITMAEALMAFSAMMLLLSMVLMVGSLTWKTGKNR